MSITFVFLKVFTLSDGDIHFFGAISRHAVLYSVWILCFVKFILLIDYFLGAGV